MPVIPRATRTQRLELRSQAIGRIGPVSKGVVAPHEWIIRNGLAPSDRVPVGVTDDLLLIGAPGTEAKILALLGEIAGSRR